MPILPVLAVLAIVVMAFMSMRIGRVQPGQVGVFVNNLSGSINVEMRPGANVYNGMISDFYILDNSVQTIRMVQENGDPVRVKTDDGSDVTMDVEVNYRLMQDPQLLMEQVVPESGLRPLTAVAPGQRGQRTRRGRSTTELVDAYKAKWVRDYARSVVRHVFGELDTKTFYNATERDRKTAEAKDELNQLLAPHGIEIQQVVPDAFRFIAEFETIIAETQTAEEQVGAWIRKAEAATEDQKRLERVAEATAAKEIATVKGELAKAILAAEAAAEKETRAAEAYAYTKKQGADADFYQAKNEALSKLAVAKAEADGLRRLAASLEGEGGINVVKMEYAKALQTANIRGVPYATDPTIQKVEISGESGAPLSGIGGKR